MPRTNEIRANMNNSSVQSTSSHETAYSVINGNVLNLLISLGLSNNLFTKSTNNLNLITKMQIMIRFVIGSTILM